MDYSKICWIFAFVQFVSVLQLAESSIECRSNEPGENNSTCEEKSLESRCSSNIPRPSEISMHLQECFPSHKELSSTYYGDPGIDYGNINVDGRCLRLDVFGNTAFDACTSTTLTTSNSQERLFYKPVSVNTTITSAGVRSFNMSVSWMMSSNDYANARSLQGYEIRVRKVSKKDGDIYTAEACICVRNKTQQRYDLPLPLKYDPDNGDYLRVTVSTFPRLQSEHTVPNPTGLFTNSAAIADWPTNCYSQEVVHTDQNCGPPQLGSPRNIQATWSQESSSSEMSEDTARLDISWDPPLNTMNTSSYRTPHSYYLSVQAMAGDFYVIFQANNTRNVSLYGLNSTRGYTVSVQAYEPCSGYVPITERTISDNPCSMSGRINRNPFRPVETTTATTAVDTTVDTTVMSTATVEKPFVRQARVHIIGASVGIVVTILVVVILVGIVAVARYNVIKCHELKPPPPPPLPPIPPFKPNPVINGYNVLVVFPLDTPSDKEIFIRARISELEFYEDCSIKVEFIVDSKTGIVAVTWDDQIRIATKILLICTPEFCKEWANTSVESPNFTLFHLLKANLTSTVNDSNKYTAVTFNRNHSLPTNNLLSAIPRIDVESEADMDGLLSHITNTPRFQIVYPETVDVQPKAPNHYTISAASPVQPSEGPYNDLHCNNIAYPPPCVHLNLEPRDLDSELSDLAISPTSDGTVETLSTSSSECSSIEMS